VSRTRPPGRCASPARSPPFHLDKLIEHGLLETSYRRLTGRRGPGAGWTLYRRSAVQLDISLPARDYELAARLFARALAGTPPTTLARVRRAARDLGGPWVGKAPPRDRVPGAPPCSGVSMPSCGSTATSRSARPIGRSGCATARSTRWRRTIARWCAA
jgi:hypothetical protein